ncbi:MAG: toxin-antitoxin system YwqK family antitoxin [Bacteroidales bacterium]|nr:toxin-antitoxin system YwqK family antitoxin [Bacteroidales bacterium]
MKTSIKITIAFLVFISISCGSGNNPGGDDGTQVQIKYNQLGKVESEISHIDGIKHGPSKHYYDNGKLQYIIQYEQGKKHGESIWYYESGKVYQVTPFVNGEEHGTRKKYYESGNLQAEVPFWNGEQQPGLKEYTEDGKLLTKYPEIVFVKPVRESTGNRFTLKMHLSNNTREVAFTQLVISESGDTITAPVPTRDGVGEIPFFVNKGGYTSATIHVSAVTKTKLNNRYVTSGVYEVKIRN